jgi:hypothetical protein
MHYNNNNMKREELGEVPFFSLFLNLTVTTSFSLFFSPLKRGDFRSILT